MTAPQTAQSAPPTPDTDAMLGQFVYRDLMTPDPAAARAFYGALLGWRCTPRVVSGMEYTDVAVDGRPFGGMVPLDPAHGIPPHWTGYVAVDDVAAACARAQAAGGTIFVPTHDIPDGTGQFAVFGDPTGAAVSVVRFTNGHQMPAGGTVAGGAWWHELLTTDLGEATAFYAAVFGWEARPVMTLPDGVVYHILSRAGRDVGGLMQAPADMPQSAWQLYFVVDDVDAAVARAESSGGAATWPAMDVPGTGRMAGLADPAGAMFAVGRAAAM